MATFEQDPIWRKHRFRVKNHPDDFPERGSILGVAFPSAASNGASGLHVSLADPAHVHASHCLVSSVSARRREALHFQKDASSLRIRSLSYRRRPRRRPFLRPHARGWHTHRSYLVSPSLGMAPVREASMTNLLALILNPFGGVPKESVQAFVCRRQGRKVIEPGRSGLSLRW